MRSSRGRRRQVPTEGSWRLVDGENESFDTRYLSSFDDEHLSSQPLGSQSSSNYPSQRSFSASQGDRSFASQDSIRDFTNYQDDEQVILREPFRPTMPPSVASASTAVTRPSSQYHNSNLQLRMPRVNVDGSLTSSEKALVQTTKPWKLRQSSLKKRESEDECEDRYPIRRRRKSKPEQQTELLPGIVRQRRVCSTPTRKSTSVQLQVQAPKSSPRPLSASLHQVLGILRLFFSYLTIPLILVSAIYFFYNSGLLLHDLSLEPFSFPVSLTSLTSIASITSVCRIPGASHISLPFCNPENPESQSSIVCNINFEDLIDTQEKFEDILLKGSRGSSMPLDLEGSEVATRNLRSLLKDSDVPRKYELLAQLNSYIENVGRASPDMQAFYIHIGSTADSIVNINRWTLRHISSLSVEPETPQLPAVIAWVAWLFNPFKPSRRDRHDRVLLEKYTEHIVLVQDRLERLADEGSILALLLSHSQNHLSEISNLTKHSYTNPTLASKPSSLLSSIWSLVGGSLEDEQRARRDRLDLFEKVDAQFSTVIFYLYEIIDDVKDIHAELADLLRQSVEPNLAWIDETASSITHSTLHEQINIVRNSLRRLENARKRNA